MPNGNFKVMSIVGTRPGLVESLPLWGKVCALCFHSGLALALCLSFLGYARSTQDPRIPCSGGPDPVQASSLGSSL